MQRVALVTDSTAGLSPAVSVELGITVVPASFAFAEERVLDGAVPWKGVYERMQSGGVAPRTFGVAEAGFRTAFEDGLKRCEAVFCLLTPFDVNPSFTTACAAMLAVQFDQPEARIKVANAGLGSAGLGALMMAISGLARAGATVEDLAAAVDYLEPRCDSLAVVEDSAWLERSGRLQLVEERLGPLDGGLPVLRLGSRLTGLAVEPDRTAAQEKLVDSVGSRAGRATLYASVLHADAPADAARIADAVRRRYNVARLEISDLPATHGAFLGPGAVVVGVCPMPGRED